MKKYYFIKTQEIDEITGKPTNQTVSSIIHCTEDEAKAQASNPVLIPDKPDSDAISKDKAWEFHEQSMSWELVDNPNWTYQNARSEEYPTLAEQFDSLWHAIDSGQNLKKSDFYKKNQEIKQRFPKPPDHEDFAKKKGFFKKLKEVKQKFPKKST